MLKAMLARYLHAIGIRLQPAIIRRQQSLNGTNKGLAHGLAHHPPNIKPSVAVSLKSDLVSNRISNQYSSQCMASESEI